MAETNGKAKKRFITAACECRYPWLMVPDTKFNADGKYRVELIMTAEQLKTIGHDVLSEVKEQTVKVKVGESKDWTLVWPFKDEIDEETEKPTGRRIVTFDQNAKITRGNGQVDLLHIAVLDSKNKLVHPNLKLGTGSVLKVCFRPRVVASKITKDIRVKFHPLAAQVITLVEWKQDFGFGQEDGYVADADETVPKATGTPMASDDPFADDQSSLSVQAAVSAFRDAWAGFKKKMNGQDAGAVQNKWATLKESWFGSRTNEQVRADEWKALTKSDYADAPPEAALDPVGSFAEDDIPFSHGFHPGAL